MYASTFQTKQFTHFSEFKQDKIG